MKVAIWQQPSDKLHAKNLFLRVQHLAAKVILIKLC
jgi:hypothetical protein